MKKIIILAIMTVLILANYSEGQFSKSSASNTQPVKRNTFVQIAKQASPTVVNVFNKGAAGVFGMLRTKGLGTGFIIDKKGLILTNWHVVRGAKKLAIALNDKRIFTVKLLGVDTIMDVALIQIENPPSNLKQVKWGNSDNVKVGEWVLAIGQPSGIEYTVTAGIVCGLGREVRIGKEQREVIEYVRECIQIDALINPGNSGGPLFNLNGEVIGINSAVRTGRAGGYGLTLPINIAREIKDQILKDGRVTRAYLGINGYDITESLAGVYNVTLKSLLNDLGLKEAKGVFLRPAAENSPAEEIEFVEGDILIEFAGKKVDDLKGFRAIIAKLKPDTEVELKYLRKGTEKSASVTLGELGGSDEDEDD